MTVVGATERSCACTGGRRPALGRCGDGDGELTTGECGSSGFGDVECNRHDIVG
jgi:hypothetical protein